MKHSLCAAVPMVFLAVSSPAQSLFLKPERQPLGSDGKPDPYAGLRSVSLTFLEPPKIRTFAMHDQVVIIIDESSQQTSKQKLDTKKDYKNDVAVADFIDMQQLPNFTLQGHPSENGTLLGVKAKH